MALLRVREVAEELKVSRTFVYQLTGRGALRVVRLGRAVRVDSEVLRAFIAAGGRPPTAPERRPA